MVMVPRGGVQQVRDFNALQPEGRKRKRHSPRGAGLSATRRGVPAAAVAGF
jgi:hypothetical protein